jgi:hypothetical protein
MILLKWRVFSVALLLAISAAMPGVTNAQTQTMNEISLNGSSASGTKSDSSVGTVSSLDGGTIDGTGTTSDASPASTTGPEAAAFDGTYVWVATQFNNSITRIRVSDSTVAGAFLVGKRPVALLYAAGYIWCANLFGNTVTKVTPSTGAIAATYNVADGPGGLAFDGTNIWVANRHKTKHQRSHSWNFRRW